MVKMYMAMRHMMSNKKKIFFGLYPQDEDKFAGEYIAVVKGKIVAHGKDPGNVYKRAKRLSSKPLFTVVPSGGWKGFCRRMNESNRQNCSRQFQLADFHADVKSAIT